MGDVFTFDTPEAVLRVLASIRSSAATTDQKNELRDLVLSYTNGGKDPSLQIQITQRLQSLGVTIAPVAVKATPAVVHDFGSARNVPTFVPGKVATTSAPAPKPEPSQAPAEPTPETAAAPAKEKQPPQPEPQPEPAPAPAPVAPTPPVESVASMAESAPAAAEPSNTDDALNRIREIKSLVNQKVGNPVNLVDINNTVGREYMSALLDAMKQLNAGSGSEAVMARLEAAYQAVEEVLKAEDARPGQPAVAAATVPQPAPKPVATAAPQPSIAPAPQAASPAPEPIKSPAPATAVPISTPAHSPEPVTPTPAGDRWDKDITTPTPTPVPTPPAPSRATVAPVSAPQPAPATPPVPSSAVKPLTQSAPPLKSLADVPTAASVNASATGDPLFTTEVSNGLNQLLGDWMLFKKSGLFGTGPKGAEHPMYLKMKDLQIPLLLAGRFEGATQEIKQSVTDYMNGWRYEQGIIYEQGETFDHYLRRVIRHILDLQK